MKAQLIMELGCACEACRHGSQGCQDFPTGKKPIGTILESPNCWKLVRMGAAICADEECEQRVNMTDRELATVQHAQRRVRAGIHPEDYDAFDAGEMTGYYPDGSFIPGPNATISEGGILLDDHDYDE